MMNNICIMIKNKRFVIDKYNLGLNKLTSIDIGNRRKKYNIEPLTENDNIAITGYIALQQPYLLYSHINLPNTSILKKAT